MIGIPLVLALLFVVTAVLVGFIGTFLWRKKRREGKFPLPHDLRVTRMPGESLKRDLMRLDESFLHSFFAAIFLPLLLGFIPLLLHRPGKTWAPGTLIALVSLVLLGLVLGVGRMLKIAAKIRSVRLGMLGERVVADQLECLKEQGYSVFHDVPCQGGSGRFNLDHVVVGRGAVAVIETKTRRKKSGQYSDKDNEVGYDGNHITWPGWKGHSEIKQVLRNAQWLSKRLKEKLNIEPQVHPFIAIPGWKVKTGYGHPVTVQNHKGLPGAILNVCKGSLTADQEDLIMGWDEV